MNITYAGQTYKVLSTDGDVMTVTPVSATKEIVAGSRVRYGKRTGTVRETWFGYCSTHYNGNSDSAYSCGCHPGARIDWDDTTKRCSNVLFANLVAL